MKCKYCGKEIYKGYSNGRLTILEKIGVKIFRNDMPREMAREHTCYSIDVYKKCRKDGKTSKGEKMTIEEGAKDINELKAQLSEAKA